ncbi:aldo/keto reductase [Robiginitalea aurantiaca]|uniref:Aldo/keto reductase n=1 Tax=Robiginitalea aurantiaca TaxID=3056915 RepID=A0ABT7WE91_9FLAO|nr:aldo/keto reductase [Robiginitalea aurantiaca]MDM9631246.1 aldo/keto reductase [Robiginitalea aurantiaca]
MKNTVTYSGIIAGTMTWGSWGRQYSQGEMASLINRCLEMGITTFDHADIYGGYTTEADFGKAFSESGVDRQNVQFISKCGIQMPSEARPLGVKHYEYGTDYIIHSAVTSLQHLKTEYLDLLLLHRPSPLMHPEEVAAAFSALRDSGKVRAFGVSNFTPSQISLIGSAVPVEAHQFECSLTAETPLWDGTLDDCIVHGRTAMAWSPLGTYFREANEQNTRIADCLKPLCEKYQATETQLLLAWLLRHPAAIHPVVGTTKPERLQESMDSMNLDLELQDWFLMLEASQGSEVP